jgi:hypothetical protein
VRRARSTSRRCSRWRTGRELSEQERADLFIRHDNHWV